MKPVKGDASISIPLSPSPEIPSPGQTPQLQHFGTILNVDEGGSIASDIVSIDSDDNGSDLEDDDPVAYDFEKGQGFRAFDADSASVSDSSTIDFNMPTFDGEENAGIGDVEVIPPKPPSPFYDFDTPGVSKKAINGQLDSNESVSIGNDNDIEFDIIHPEIPEYGLNFDVIEPELEVAVQKEVEIIPPESPSLAIRSDVLEMGRPETSELVETTESPHVLLEAPQIHDEYSRGEEQCVGVDPLKFQAEEEIEVLHIAKREPSFQFPAPPPPLNISAEGDDLGILTDADYELQEREANNRYSADSDQRASPSLNSEIDVNDNVHLYQNIGKVTSVGTVNLGFDHSPENDNSPIEAECKIDNNREVDYNRPQITRVNGDYTLMTTETADDIEITNDDSDKIDTLHLSTMQQASGTKVSGVTPAAKYRLKHEREARKQSTGKRCCTCQYSKKCCHKCCLYVMLAIVVIALGIFLILLLSGHLKGYVEPQYSKSVASTFTGSATIDMPYSDQLANSNSNEFKDVANKFENAMVKAFSTASNYKGISVNSMSPGSVIIYYEIFFHNPIQQGNAYEDVCNNIRSINVNPQFRIKEMSLNRGDSAKPYSCDVTSSRLVPESNIGSTSLTQSTSSMPIISTTNQTSQHRTSQSTKLHSGSPSATSTSTYIVTSTLQSVTQAMTTTTDSTETATSSNNPAAVTASSTHQSTTEGMTPTKVIASTQQSTTAATSLTDVTTPQKVQRQRWNEQQM